MGSATPLANTVVLAWLKLPLVKQAFTVDQTNFAPACAEILRNFFASKLLGLYSGRDPQKSPQPRRYNSSEFQRSYKLQFTFELVQLFFYHPLVVCRWFLHLLLPPSFSTTPADILLFSNGLHLGSYSELIQALHQSHPVRVVTDRQSPLDAFYLSQYHLFPQAVTFRPGALDHQLLSVLDRQLNRLRLTLPPQTKLPSWITRRKLTALLTVCVRELRTKFLPSFLAKYALASDIIAQTQPQLLITTHDPGPTAMAFVTAAKKQGIPTLILLHGIPSEGWYFFSDYQLVWGSYTKKFIASQRIAAKKLISGGQPIFYTYQQYFRHHPPSPNAHRPVVGIILSGYGANQPHQLNYVHSLTQQLFKLKPQPKVIVRAHPGQYVDAIAPAHLDLGRTIEEFISHCHVVISQTSTAALIAAISKRPLIYFPAFHPLIPQGVMWRHRAFASVTSAGQAVKIVQQLIDQPSYRVEYLKKQRQQVKNFTGPIHKRIGQTLAQKITRQFFHD